MKPLACHITWGTYGTRLHGDPRGTVDRENTEYGTPVLGPDPSRWAEMKQNLKCPPRKLTRGQMLHIERAIPRICTGGNWHRHESAAGPDHVHVLLTSTREPTTIRRILKRWLGEDLSTTWTFPPNATWWSEGGSIRWIHDPAYLTSATNYVRRQRATDRASY